MALKNTKVQEPVVARRVGAGRGEGKGAWDQEFSTGAQVFEEAWKVWKSAGSQPSTSDSLFLPRDCLASGGLQGVFSDRKDTL